MISTDDDVENFVNLFRPLAGQQAVEVFRLGRADVLQNMGEPLPGILPKRLARTEKGVHYGGAAAGVVIPAVQVGVLAHHHVAYLPLGVIIVNRHAGYLYIIREFIIMAQKLVFFEDRSPARQNKQACSALVLRNGSWPYK